MAHREDRFLADACRLIGRRLGEFSVLDLGCGGGRREFAAATNGVVGIDVSLAALRQARKLYATCV